MNVAACGRCETPISSYSDHFHNEWEIVLCLTGTMHCKAGKSVYQMSKGDVLITPPDMSHLGKYGEDYTDIYIKANKMDFKNDFLIHDSDGSIGILSNMILKVMTEKERNYALISDNLLETICQYIKKHSETNYKYAFVTEFKNKIYDNLSNPDFNITQEIHKMGFNHDYFRRCFKEDLNKTPLEYLTELRINRAKSLLKHELFISIEDVAQNCGFNDSFYFSTCFKKHIGMSPRQFRKT